MTLTCLSAATCRFCGTPLSGADFVVCARCETPFHRDCWEEGSGGCSIYACGGRLALDGPAFVGRRSRVQTGPAAPAVVQRPLVPESGPAVSAFSLEGFEEGPGGIHFDVAAEERLAREMASGRYDSASWFDLRLEAERMLLISGFEELVSLPAIDVVPFAHQLTTASRVLRQMRGLAILADDVGLGKTIEAGIILKELTLRGLARKVLVLCPAGLVGQWQSELLEKFREDFVVNDALPGWRKLPRVIASYDTAKRPSHVREIHAQDYDLVIVDEAHKVHGSGHTQRHRLVEGIRKRYMLLLTATPVQNDLIELYRLVEVLRPGHLGTVQHFRREFLQRGNARVPRDPARLKGLVTDVMVRNGREKVGLDLPPRTVQRRQLELSEAERELYDGVRSFLAAEAKRPGGHLLVTVLQTRICSSSRALSSCLKVLARGRDRSPAERDELLALARLADGVPADAKLAALHDVLMHLAGRKCVVFTGSRETQAFLDERLAKEGVPIALYHGGLNRFDRQLAFEAFRRDAQLLIATDAGAEGLNLQFASCVVSYDLPWNPMRLEQRIGRVHRIGQRSEVLAFNLVTAGTIEERILDLLEKKIRMFEMVVGELGLLLGEIASEESFERAISRIWLESRTADEEERAFDELGNKILEAREVFEKVRLARKLNTQLLE